MVEEEYKGWVLYTVSVTDETWQGSGGGDAWWLVNIVHCTYLLYYAMHVGIINTTHSTTYWLQKGGEGNTYTTQQNQAWSQAVSLMRRVFVFCEFIL